MDNILIKKDGLVYIHRINIDDKVGMIFDSSKCGKIKILSQNGKTNRNIKLYIAKFLNTGTLIQAQFSNIKNGNVIDPMAPLNHGIGYLGMDYIEYRNKDRDLYDVLKHRWSLMLARCYDKSNKRYFKYGGNNVTVSKRWYNFSKYYKDVITIKGFNRDRVIAGELQLDKDLLQKNLNSKIYSKDTCIWITRNENCKLRELERKIKCTYPNGDIEILESVQECMRRFNIYTWNLYRVLKGVSKHHKGYKFEYYTD